MIKQKLTRLQEEIFRLLCLKAGKKLNQSEIASMLEVSSAAVSKSIPLLEKEKLINVDRSNKIKLILVELNRDNSKTVELKRVENLRLIYESGLLDYLEVSFPGKTIVLFGSFSRGEDTTSSDIDIAIFAKNKDIDLGKYEKVFMREINIQFVAMQGMHKELLSNICNGIVLSGAIEL